MSLTLQELEALTHEARRLGARGAEVLLVDHDALTLVTNGRTSPDRRRDAGTVLHVRCWAEGGRRGEASGAPGDGLALLRHAATVAAEAPEDPFGGPLRRSSLPARGLGIDDQRHDQITDADRLEVVVTNQRAAARAQHRVRLGPFGYHEARVIRRFANNHGVNLEAAHTTYEAWGSLVLPSAEGDVHLADHIAGRAFASIACLPYGAVLAQRADALAAEGPALDGPVRVLLPPRATGALMAWLAPMFAVDALERGGTFVARSQGEPLFHRRLHLVDDGSLPGGLRTRGFDDRGVIPVPLTLLREGRVAARLLDPESARRLDTRPTGHCWPGGLEPTNLQLNGGARSINAWLGEQDQQVFEVDDLPDLSGIDPDTGDLDLVVHGRLHDRHTVLGARRHVRLRGNLLTALNQVHGVASDTDRINHVDAPGIFLDGLSVHG